MKAAKNFLMFVVMSGLLTLAVSWSVLVTITSASSLSHIFSGAGVYEYTAGQARATIQSSDAVPEQYRGVVNAAIEGAITAERLETITQPLLVDVVSWIEQPAGTPPPKLVINISSIKQEIVRSLQSAEITAIEKLALVSQVGKLLPDQLDLTEAQALAGTTTGTLSGSDANAVVQPETSPIDTALSQIKSGVVAARIMLLIGLGLTIGGLIMLVWISRRDGRAMLRRPAKACLIVAVLLAVFCLIVSLLPSTGSLASASIPMQFVESAIAPFLREVGLIMRWTVVLIGAVGIALYGISFALPKVAARAEL